MRKKLLYGTICVALSAMLIGCGSNNTSSSNSSNNTAESDQVEDSSNNSSDGSTKTSDSNISENFEDVASMSYDEASAYLDTLSETDVSKFTICTNDNDNAGVLEDGECSIVSYTGNDAVVIVPAEIDGLTVVSIGQQCFAKNDTLTAIKLPTTTRIIQNGAFYKCQSLSIATGLDNIVTLEAHCFDTGANTKLKFTDSVTESDNSPFYSGVSLQIKKDSYLSDNQDYTRFWGENWDVTIY